MHDTWKRMAARVVTGALGALLLALSVSGEGVAMDRDELGKVIKSLPPNGPFWKYGNVVMRARSRKAGLAPVVFSHWSHRSRYTCRVCHQELGFSMRLGDTGITRNQLLAGKLCGACHNGALAFTVKDGPRAQCGKCHLDSTTGLERQFDKFAAALPMAPFGNGIDWSAALRDGTVNPANALDASQVAIQFPEKLREPLKLGTTSPRSDVSFSHEDHFAELDCSSCHPAIFNIKRKSTTAFTMDSSIYGNFCGACHLQVAFPMNDCRRCHKSMGSASF